MARTGMFGGFEFDEEVFASMMAEEDFWSTPIITSGIVRTDSVIMDLIGKKGNVATIPIYKPLNLYEAGMDALNNDGVTDNTPVEISGDKQTCMLSQRMKAFKAKDFTKELTGADPLTHIKSRITGYYAQVWERELMNTANAVLANTSLADHVTDLSITTGTVGEGNMIADTTLIDAEQAALGDMAGGLGLIVMHSKIFARYKKLELINYRKYAVGEGALRHDVELPTIGGKIPLVTDYNTVDMSVSGFPVFKTYIFGEGAFLSADKTNYEKQYTTNYDPEKSAGTEAFYTKQGRVLHPNGMSLAVDNIAKESPTFAELGNASNWTLKFNHKNVKMGLIKSNG